MTPPNKSYIQSIVTKKHTTTAKIIKMKFRFKDNLVFKNRLFVCSCNTIDDLYGNIYDR